MTEKQAEIQGIKKERKTLKWKLTRECNTLNQKVIEEKEDEVRDGMKALSGRFHVLEVNYDSLVSLIKDESEVDECDAYLEEARKQYLVAYKEARDYLKSIEEDKLSKKDAEKRELSHAELISLVTLPKVEIEAFDGNPKQYYQFMTLFNENVHHTSLDPTAKLSRLIHYTKGAARKAIENCIMLGPGGYDEALSVLKERFGDSVLVTQQLIRDIRSGKSVRSGKELQEFSDELKGCYTTLKSMGQLGEIDSHFSIVEILGRLQPYIRIRWRKQVVAHKSEHGNYPDFKRFVDFINRLALEANEPIYSEVVSRSKPTVPERPKKAASSYNTTVSESLGSGVSKARPLSKPSGGGVSGNRGTPGGGSASSSRGPPSSVGYQRRPVKDPCVKCGEMHRLFYCDVFKKMTVPERIELVKCNKLCENCLLGNHTTDQCRKQSVCSVVNCGKKHTKFIHQDESTNSASNIPDTSTHESVYSSSKAQSGVVVPTVMVCVNGKQNVSALLDSASTASFCSERLIRDLEIQGIMVSYQLNTISAVNETKRSMIVDLNICSSDGLCQMKLHDVHVIKSIPVSMPDVSENNYSHLKGLKIEKLDSGHEVDLLIGQDHAEALIPLEVRKGKKGDPFAVRTMFGWSINGPVRVSDPVKKKVISQFLCNIEVNNDLKRLWEIEGDTYSEETSWSKEDKRVIKLWEDSVELVNGHYVLPVPWKPSVTFPNNYVVALTRLRSLLKSLAKKGLTKRYDQEIQKLLDNCYAEPVPVSGEEISTKVWYLPHHAVITDKKPDKVRVVFDCAAKYRGESLNDKAFQGPDLVNKLVNVLLRFRENSVAIMADVEAMYNQVRIPEQDRDALRFLWQDNNGEVVSYRMTSHLFGGIWCASSSTFALRRVLEDNTVPDLVREAIQNAFYVDDCLDSLTNGSDAETVVFGTKRVLGTAGFNLTKIITTDPELMEKIPEKDRAKEVKELSSSPQSKALGICWDVNKDEFYYQVNVQADVDVTKRMMLSVIASMYDPLGLVIPVVMSGRLILQEVVRMNVGWDDVIDVKEIVSRWRAWVLSLVDHIGRLRFKRCVTLSDQGATVELHHFSDASESAYGSCSYVRCITADGRVHVALIMSKGRIAPLKQMTIPRLELQAAVLSARADVILRTELRLKISRSYFWSDSEIVIAYLRNESARFHVFVGNRVSQISSLTNVEDWRHVPGPDNPADLITRIQSPRTMDLEKWVQGPKFLWNPDWECEERDLNCDLKNDPEVKEVSTVYAVTERTHPIDLLAEHYSSWYRLKRALAYWRRLVTKKKSLRHDDSSTGLTVWELRSAETVLVQHVQKLYYEDEVARLSSGRALLKSSSIRDLDPMLDKDGLLIVGGRVKHADLLSSCKHPVIIPYGHIITILIVRDAHCQAHLGTEWTMCILRERYWVVKARVLVKRIKKQCVDCKKLYASPCSQRMADLPPERLDADKPPFSKIGCDCFGPFLCKVGRADVKRYGLICTCFSIRAIHLEMLNSLSTDSFLNGFRRFVARRGQPEKVFCDNGTNFVGAQSEVDRAKSELDFKRIKAYGVESNMEWCFNPPHASHMGGVWERMIRTVRKVMAAVMKDARLTEDVLMTTFTEVESIVNGRPLTKLSDDVEDMTPLTPNHLLLLRAGPDPIPGVFGEADQFRRRWRQVQHLANQFWSRWMKEYLPSLQQRKKWQDGQENVKVGDLVLLVDENMPRRVWPLGLIVGVNTGRDGLVRSVRIKTQATTLVRPVTKIVLLEVG